MRKIFPLLVGVVCFLILPVWVAITLLPSKNGILYSPVEFSDLQGWNNDNPLPALNSFKKSCTLLLSFKASTKMPDSSISGNMGEWQDVCRIALAISSDQIEDARKFFQTQFQPLEVSYNGNKVGQFTGYHEPILNGSFEKSQKYHIPLYKKPDNLVSINLGEFRSKYQGESLTGIVESGRMIPFHSRQQIIKGALENRGLELLWVDSAVDAFFLQVQGSGRVKMEDGTIISVGYSGKNGHPYRSIGKVLIENNEMRLEDVSAQSIKAWLENNKDKAEWLLDQNPSFVFFRLLGETSGPYGSANVTLTPERSIAVDRRFIPLHAPVWVDASRPDHNNPDNHNIPFQKLLIAQDTGGAIKGAIRGDVFWGHGAKSDEIAGRMNNKGKLYFFLPHKVSKRLLNNEP